MKAQYKWSVEFRPDINFPTADFDDYKIQNGYGFELTGAFQFTGHFLAYGSWSNNTFNIEGTKLTLMKLAILLEYNLSIFFICLKNYLSFGFDISKSF